MLSVMSCLAFVLLTSLFNAHPRDNIIGAASAYVVMLVLKVTHAKMWICHTDAFNALLASAIGICFNQRNTRRNIGKKLYMDMYKATIKTSILVSQFDIVHDTFVVLHSPSYMNHVLSQSVNVGSTFTLTIPLKINYEIQPEKKQEQGKVETAGKRVLLVEDNELNIEIAQFLLEKEGFLVTQAHNGQEAVEQFAASDISTFDIIFMDIMMPVMSGIEATQAIRAMDRADAKEVPIIAMSANAFQDDIENSLAAGMNLHLMKPIDVAKLKQAIQEVLGGEQIKGAKS